MKKTTHPPAGAHPIIFILGAYNWAYLFSPVLIEAVIIVLVALVLNNLRSNRAYPVFWR
ncbi:MAG: HPP family protein [Kurthia sp.]|nr:HPP family protein [Candidatus Kurthia equi]